MKSPAPNTLAGGSPPHTLSQPSGRHVTGQEPARRPGPRALGWEQRTSTGPGTTPRRQRAPTENSGRLTQPTLVRGLGRHSGPTQAPARLALSGRATRTLQPHPVSHLTGVRTIIPMDGKNQQDGTAMQLTGDRMREARRLRKLTQTELARRVRTSSSQISMMEDQQVRDLAQDRDVSRQGAPSLPGLLGRMGGRSTAHTGAARSTEREDGGPGGHRRRLRLAERARSGVSRSASPRSRARPGPEATVHDEHVETRVNFPARWLFERGLRPSSCRFIRVRGESMEPTLPDGSLILVDLATEHPKSNKIFVIRTGDELIGEAAGQGHKGGLATGERPPAEVAVADSTLAQRRGYRRRGQVGGDATCRRRIKAPNPAPAGGPAAPDRQPDHTALGSRQRTERPSPRQRRERKTTHHQERNETGITRGPYRHWWSSSVLFLHKVHRKWKQEDCPTKPLTPEKQIPGSREPGLSPGASSPSRGEPHAGSSWRSPGS